MKVEDTKSDFVTPCIKYTYICITFNGCDLFVYNGMLTVSKPAPDWNGTAVVDGKIKEIKLADYKGKYLVFFFYPSDL